MDPSFEGAIEFARDLIRLPSLPGGEGDVARRVAEEMRALGFDEVGLDESGSAVGRIAGGGGPAVMLSSHLDVVDAGDPAEWEHPPFEARVEGGVLHGRGAMDIKGPLAIQTHAAAEYARSFAGGPPGDVIVAHTVLEERGGWGMSRLLESGEVRPDAVIIGESTHGDVCIGHRGRAELEVRVRGVAGHASAPERAANALAPLGRVLEAIEAFAATLGGDPILGPSTIAATDVSARPTSRNVIPDVVTVICDWRVLPGESAESARGRLEAWLRERVPLEEPYTLEVANASERQRTWTGHERDGRLFTPGFLLSAEHPVALAAVEAVERATGRRPTLRPWTFATDGGHACGVHGIPTIGYAPGEERYAHTNVERLPLEEARVAYDAYPALIGAVQQAAG
ncbi:MAG: M20/M25/M40 family metallo-hydrolase [Gemmatimonadota bacterium]